MASVGFRWLDILEKEFDKAFVDLDLEIGEVFICASIKYAQWFCAISLALSAGFEGVISVNGQLYTMFACLLVILNCCSYVGVFCCRRTSLRGAGVSL